MRKTILYVTCLLLSACCWHSPNANFYVMNSTKQAAISDKAINVALAHVKVPDMLNKPQMVVYDNDSNQVQILEFERWAETFPDVLQSAITNDLISYFPKGYIRPTDFDSQSANLNVHAEINRFETYVGDKVILNAWWHICDQNNKVIKRHQGQYISKIKGDDISAAISAQSETIHQMSLEIAKQLLKYSK